ncbi:MAG: hypothetical protein ACYTXC_26580 [Nostoc sp.]
MVISILIGHWALGMGHGAWGIGHWALVKERRVQLLLKPNPPSPSL